MTPSRLRALFWAALVCGFSACVFLGALFAKTYVVAIVAVSVYWLTLSIALRVMKG